MDAVDHHSQQRHLLLVIQAGHVRMWPRACQFRRDLSDLLVKGSKNFCVFVLGVDEDQTNHLRPHDLLVFDKLVDGGKDLILFLARRGNSVGRS